MKTIIQCADHTTCLCVQVVCVLKGLLEDGEILLSDGNLHLNVAENVIFVISALCCRSPIRQLQITFIP
jgi:hypothetical protein